MPIVKLRGELLKNRAFQLQKPLYPYNVFIVIYI